MLVLTRAQITDERKRLTVSSERTWILGLNGCLAGETWTVLDEFGSFDAADFGVAKFETVTYMLEGYMEHRDHMDNLGRLGPGDVQWMNAGSGVIRLKLWN